MSGTLEAGQAYIVPNIAIKIASTTTDVKVGVDTEEVAEVQIKEQEKQRVLGFIPNFYASYVPNAAPLSSKLKYQLAFRSVTDPISILGAGFMAGIYQASDQFSGYGQGAAGYGKRFGATYADQVIGTFVDGAILPSLFHQDPRYFYKGTGTKKSRLVYAIENAVICRGDNGQRQVNYSAIINRLPPRASRISTILPAIVAANCWCRLHSSVSPKAALLLSFRNSSCES